MLLFEEIESQPYFNNFRYKKTDLGKFSVFAKNVSDKITPKCRILGLTNGTFSLIDLIYEILNKIGKSDVIITTWSAGIKDAMNVRWLIENDLIDKFSLITDHSYATRQKKYALTLDYVFGKENIRTSEIHAKFTLIKNENYNIVIRTSMNLNANKTCENFEIDDDIEIYNFYYNFIKHTFDKSPEGFEPKSFIANKTLKEFFNSDKKEQNYKSEYIFFKNE